jgi:hypothetical protein
MVRRPVTGPDPLRTAHGNGASALLRAETPALGELPPLNVDDTAAGLAAVEARGRPFQRGNSAGANRKPALCLLGVPIEAADPRYRAAMRKAKAYMERRRRDLAVQHGGQLGAGPCAMLASAALALGASRVLYELASVTLEPALFAQAAKLGDSARQQELTAVALASREGQARGEDEGARIRAEQAAFQKTLAERSGK